VLSTQPNGTQRVNTQAVVDLMRANDMLKENIAGAWVPSTVGSDGFSLQSTMQAPSSFEYFL
jgi:hypothetical protein